MPTPAARRREVQVTVDLYGKRIPGASASAVDRLEADEGAGGWRIHPHPPRNQSPETQNPRGRAVA